MRKFIFILLTLSFFNLRAQDTIRVDKASLGGNYTAGNSENFQISAKSTISYQNGKLKRGIIFSPDYFIMYNGGNEGFVKKSEDLRAAFFGWKDLNESYSIIAFSDLEHSYSKKIDLRVAGGVGVKKIIKSKYFKSSTSIAPLYDEMFIRGDRYGNARISLRQTINTTLLGVNINTIFMYQPAVWSTSDFRMSENTNSTLMFELSKKISNNISFGVQYDSWYSVLPSMLNSNINRMDQRISFSLIYKR